MKRLLMASMFLAGMAVLLSGCNCFKQMQKKADQVQYSCTPEVLTLKGNTVSAEISVAYPAKSFPKKAIVKATPVLVFEGGEIAGTPKYLQGEKVKDNYTVIPWKTGGTYTQTVSFPYDKRAQLSTLEVRLEVKCKNGAFLPVEEAIAVAQGISTVQNDADWTANLSIMPDNFKRVTTISEDADLIYLINSSKVRSTALDSEQIKIFEEFVKENADKYRTTLGSIYAKGYASPDGPVKFNDELSKKRSESGKEAIEKKISENVPNAKYDVAYYGEDWEGFKELVEASDIEDKDLILQVLQMYSSPVQRDQEIKNMSQVFEILKTDILPQLRRTKFVASADIQGKTDDELKAAATGDVHSLNVEEMLYAATLFSDNATKAKIYKAAADKYNDVRAYNNYGVVKAWEGDYATAKQAFQKAASIQSAPEISNNLGVIALVEGNTAEAAKYLNPLNSADAKANKALLALSEGDYATAAKGLNGYNLAVAEVCNGNLAKAKAALGNIKTADADYLKAVIAMREGDSAGAIANLKSAIAKDPAMKDKAKKDVEFAKIFGSEEFLAL